MENNILRNSFEFQIAIYLKSGKALRFTAKGARPETGPNEYFDGAAYVTLSPKELGSCEDMDSFIQCLYDGVCDGDRPIFIFAQPRRDAEGVLRDPSRFIDKIGDEMWSVGDVDFIEVIGLAYYYNDGIGFGNSHLQFYRYDMDSKRFEGIVYGDPMDAEDSAGELNICTVGCKIRRVKLGTDFKNYIEYTENDDRVDEAFGFDTPADITGFNSIDLAPFGQFADFKDDGDGEDGEAINGLFAAKEAKLRKPKWLTQMFGSAPADEDEEEEQYTTYSDEDEEEDNNMMFNTFTKNEFTLDDAIAIYESGLPDEDGPELDEMFMCLSGAYDKDDEDGEDLTELFEQYGEDDDYFDDIDQVLGNGYANAFTP